MFRRVEASTHEGYDTWRLRHIEASTQRLRHMEASTHGGFDTWRLRHMMEALTHGGFQILKPQLERTDEIFRLYKKCSLNKYKPTYCCLFDMYCIEASIY